MSITILQRSSQGMRSVKLKNGFLYSALLLFFIVPLGAAYSGYYYAMANDKRANVEQTTIDNWKNEIDQQWKQLDSAKHFSQTQINALTARLGLIQAHITRLDAASERVLSISGIDAKEFNFGSAPALGGPQKLTGKGFQGTQDLNNAFDKVKLALQSREQQLKVLESLLMDKHMGTERYISGRPTRKGWLSSFYGERSDPFTGQPAWHAGVDFAGSEGDGVFATAAGVVSWVGKRSGYGLLIEINHGDGLVTRYGHNLKALVKKGDVVKKDQIISNMGNSGRSTGAHVHYEVIKNGRPTDPAPYINRKKS